MAVKSLEVELVGDLEQARQGVLGFQTNPNIMTSETYTWAKLTHPRLAVDPIAKPYL